jgi:transcriptional regulator GlxA family with amidase domain
MGPRVVPVTVVLPPRTLLLDVAGPIEVLRKANLEQDAIRFEVRYVGPSPGVISSIGLGLSGIEPLPDSLAEDALILLGGNTAQVLGAPPGPSVRDDADEAAIVDWLRRIMGPRHRLICICSGALLAGRAGLLDGKDCTTHHACTAELQALAPRARVLENRLFVEDGNCLSSAGITAGVDLMLHVVLALAGPAVALSVARYLVVYLRRGGGDPQISPWLEGRNHLHPAIHRVQDHVLAEPAREWSLESLAALAHTSPRTLSRLFNAQAGMSVTDYINRVRVALARELVEQTRLDMESVALRAGFGSTRQLRRAWGRLHQAPPREARKSGRAAARPPQ